jgi:hypothetical protein
MDIVEGEMRKGKKQKSTCILLKATDMTDREIGHNLLWIFQQKFCMYLLTVPYTLHVPTTSSSLLSSPHYKLIMKHLIM